MCKFTSSVTNINRTAQEWGGRCKNRFWISTFGTPGGSGVIPRDAVLACPVDVVSCDTRPSMSSQALHIWHQLSSTMQLSASEYRMSKLGTQTVIPMEQNKASETR